MKKTASVIFLFLLVSVICFGQRNIGMPIIKNYSKEAYQAGLQNWDVEQDRLGKMYFANNEGLLTYDGAYWQINPVENKTIVRSLLIDDEKIYVGSQGDFGYFRPNKKGFLDYHSLKSIIQKEHQNFADVWSIVKDNESIYFRTSRKIFLYKNDTIQVISNSKNHIFLKKEKQTLYVQKTRNALSKIENEKIENVKSENDIIDAEITGIVSLGDKYLLATIESGIFLYDGNAFSPWVINDNGRIKNNRVNSMIRIDDNQIAFGTQTGGLYIVNNDGKVLYHIDINDGLQSNDILNVFKDGAGNLWLALGNGIDYVEINAPFSTILPDQQLRGIGYSVRIHNDKIYLGASNGLYTIDWKDYYNPFEERSFQLIPNTRGEAWNLDIVKDELLLGHHTGTYRVENNSIIPLSKLPGTWAFVPLQQNENLMLEGNYNGLNLYEFQNDHWKFQSQVENMIDESCRIVTQDNNGNIWVAHPYRGVYKVVLDIEKKRVDSIKLYNSKDGFPSDLYIHVFKIGDGVVFTGEYGIYNYNATTDKFEISKKWAEVINPKSRVQKLVEDKTGNIWFVIDDNVGIIKTKDYGVEKKLEKQIFPQLKGRLVGGFEYIYPFDDENVFFPLEQGFMHFNPKKYGEVDSLFHVHLEEVIQGDSTVIFGGWNSKEWVKPKFQPHQNAFTFKYNATDYSDFNVIEFQYLLKGLDEDWSVWTTKNLKEYTALPYGKYEFQVKARNALGQISEIRTFDFEILPPWYATITAKVIYFLIGLSLLLGLILIPRRKFEQEKAILVQEQEKTLQETTQVYQKIVEKNQAEINELQQQKLKSEIQFKTQELATTTMHLVQKGELLNKLKDNLNNMLKNTNDPKMKKEIRSTIQLLSQDAQLDKDWEQFAQYFDEVHVDFLKRLKEAYPQLTPKDQKLCTYLKMNLSTKEIVPLMNISVRGVEVSRYRLRKKLGLATDVNLNEFLMKF